MKQGTKNQIIFTFVCFIFIINIFGVHSIVTLLKVIWYSWVYISHRRCWAKHPRSDFSSKKSYISLFVRSLSKWQMKTWFFGVKSHLLRVTSFARLITCSWSWVASLWLNPEKWNINKRVIVQKAKTIWINSNWQGLDTLSGWNQSTNLSTLYWITGYFRS